MHPCLDSNLRIGIYNGEMFFNRSLGNGWWDLGDFWQTPMKFQFWFNGEKTSPLAHLRARKRKLRNTRIADFGQFLPKSASVFCGHFFVGIKYMQSSGISQQFNAREYLSQKLTLAHPCYPLFWPKTSPGGSKHGSNFFCPFLSTGWLNFWAMELLRYSLCGWILLIGKPLEFLKDHAVVACLKTKDFPICLQRRAKKGPALIMMLVWWALRSSSISQSALRQTFPLAK